MNSPLTPTGLLVESCKGAKQDYERAAQAAAVHAHMYRALVAKLRQQVGAEQAGRLLGISRQQVYRLTRNSKTGSSEDARGPN